MLYLIFSFFFFGSYGTLTPCSPGNAEPGCSPVGCFELGAGSGATPACPTPRSRCTITPLRFPFQSSGLIPFPPFSPLEGIAASDRCCQERFLFPLPPRRPLHAPAAGALPQPGTTAPTSPRPFREKTFRARAEQSTRLPHGQEGPCPREGCFHTRCAAPRGRNGSEQLGNLSCRGKSTEAGSPPPPELGLGSRHGASSPRRGHAG